MVGHDWGDAMGAKAEASVRCLQANGGPKQQGIAGGGGVSKNSAVTLSFGPIFVLTMLMLILAWGQ